MGQSICKHICSQRQHDQIDDDILEIAPGYSVTIRDNITNTELEPRSLSNTTEETNNRLSDERILFVGNDTKSKIQWRRIYKVCCCSYDSRRQCLKKQNNHNSHSYEVQSIDSIGSIEDDWQSSANSGTYWEFLKLREKY